MVVWSRFFCLFVLFFGVLQAKAQSATDGGLIYQVYVRAFEDGGEAPDGHGDFEGLRLRLDHLSSLGVDAIMLMPIFPSTGGMGYIPNDFFTTSSEYGSEESFSRLVRDAHSRGMKIYLDAPINHIGDYSNWFRRARQKDCELTPLVAPECGYFYFVSDPCSTFPFENWRKPWNWERSRCESVWSAPWGFNPEVDRAGQVYATFFGVMPDLRYWDYQNDSWNEPLVETMSDFFRKWTRLGVDGYRIDAAKHLVEGYESNAEAADPRNLELLEDFLSVAREVNPDVEFIGEIWSAYDVIDEYLPETLTSSLDFPFMESLREGAEEQDPNGFANALRHVQNSSAQEGIPLSMRISFSGNHDVNRLHTFTLGDRNLQKMMHALTVLLPMRPLLLYGEEVEMEGRVKRPDPEDPEDTEEYVRTDRLFPWDASGLFGINGDRVPVVDRAENRESFNLVLSEEDPESVLHFVRSLGALRSHLGLANFEIESVRTEGSLLAVRLNGPSKRLVLIANFSDSPVEIGPELLSDQGSILIQWGEFFGRGTGPSSFTAGGRSGAFIEL